MKKFIVAAICAIAATTFGAYSAQAQIKTVAPRIENGLHAPAFAAGVTSDFNANRGDLGLTVSAEYNFGKDGGNALGVTASAMKPLYWEASLKGDHGVNVGIEAYYRRDLGVFNAYSKVIPAVVMGAGICPQDQWTGVRFGNEETYGRMRHICAKEAATVSLALNLRFKMTKDPRQALNLSIGGRLLTGEGIDNAAAKRQAEENPAATWLQNPLKRQWAMATISLTYSFTCYRVRK